MVEFISETLLPTSRGEFIVRAYRNSADGTEPIALISGSVGDLENVAVRVHDQCQTSEVFGSLKCDCQQQLDFALNYIQDHAPGVVIYLHQEGRGIGLKNKLLAYQLQDSGLDTVEANEELGYAPDLREYGIGAQILIACNVRNMKLLTNNPRKIIGLEGYGLEVVGRESIEIESNPSNKEYLKTKREKLGHFIFNED